MTFISVRRLPVSDLEILSVFILKEIIKVRFGLIQIHGLPSDGAGSSFSWRFDPVLTRILNPGPVIVETATDTDLLE